MHVEDFPQGGSHGQFKNPGPLHRPADAVELAPHPASYAPTTVGLATGAQDSRQLCQGFGIVDRGRLLPKPFLRNVRGLFTRIGAASFDGVENGRILAADVTAQREMNVEAQRPRGQIEQACGLGSLQGAGKNFGTGGIFAADEEGGLAYPEGMGGNQHPLEDLLWGAEEQGAILEAAGLGFVEVADQVAGLGCIETAQAPLDPGGETRPAAAAQAGLLHQGNELRGRHGEGLLQPLVAAHPPVGCQVRRVGMRKEQTQWTFAHGSASQASSCAARASALRGATTVWPSTRAAGARSQSPRQTWGRML